MKITNSLGLRYVLKNKKRSLSTIFGITITTVLVTVIITLLSSYQQYLATSTRNKENWEIKLNNITYEKLSKIIENDNVDEISITHYIGVSNENFSNDKYPALLNVYSLDENAFKNKNIKVVEGRLPKNSNEIIISDVIGQDIKVGDIIPISISQNKKLYDFTVVGKMEYTGFNKPSFSGPSKVGSLTLLDKDKINENMTVDVGILTKNIQKVYKTGDDLKVALNINDIPKSNISEEEYINNIFNGVEDEIKFPTIEYNDKLFNYECVINGNFQFIKYLFIVFIICIVILGAVSIVIIRASLNMAYTERAKELGNLASIGMDKKQRKKMLNVETRILGIIAISIGIILGITLSFIFILVINNLIKQIHISSIIEVDSTTDLTMKIPFVSVMFIIIIVEAIIKISNMLSIKKINQLSPIEAIKNTTNMHVKGKQIKVPKLIEKVFKEEGVLAYKNIKKDTSKYKTVVYSLVISLVLFLSTNGIIKNLDKKMISSGKYDDYIIDITPTNNTVNLEKIDKIIKYLRENKLVDDCYASLGPFNNMQLELKENQVSDNFKKLSSKGDVDLTSDQNGNYIIGMQYCFILGEEYKTILKKAGITELKENEVIIANSITEKTKYGEKIDLTNLKLGDSYTLDIDVLTNKNETKAKTYTIAGVVDDFSPYIKNDFSNYIHMTQLVSPNSAMNLIKEYGYSYWAQINIKTDQKRAEKIDECMEYIKNLYGENASVQGDNHLPTDISKWKTTTMGNETTRVSTEKISAIKELQTLQILLYSFTFVVAIIAIINTFNTIYSSIILRKQEFAILKSIGMSNGKIRKMTFLEGMFYGLTSALFGVIISIIILFISHRLILQSNVYIFKVPLIAILECIFVMYVVIFLAIIISRMESRNENIINEIKDENI